MKQPTSHRWWFYLVTPVVSGMLTLVIIELGLVALHPIPFSIETNMYFDPDPFTGYRLKPNSTGYFLQIPARTNENGHRDEPVSVEKPAGVFRVLALGDSFTVGASVAQESTYPEVLETLLTQSAAGPVEVINAGVGGWDPFHYAQYYEHYGWRFSPDFILIGFFVGNDTYSQITDVHQLTTAILGRRISRKATLDPFIHLKVFMYNHSHLARLVLNKGPTIGNMSRRDCSDFSRRYLEIQRPRLGNHLRRTSKLEGRARINIQQILRIKKLAERDSIPLAVVLIPDENQINENLQQVLVRGLERGKFDFDMPQSMLMELFADAEIPAIDLLPHFRRDPRCLYMNDSHWTAEGHALAAAVIYESLTGGSAWPDLAGRFGRQR